MCVYIHPIMYNVYTMIIIILCEIDFAIGEGGEGEEGKRDRGKEKVREEGGGGRRERDGERKRERGRKGGREGGREKKRERGD